MQFGQAAEVAGVAVVVVAGGQPFQPDFGVLLPFGFLFDKQALQVVGFGFADVFRQAGQYLLRGLPRFGGLGGRGAEREFAFHPVISGLRLGAEAGAVNALVAAA